ncbi:MAG: hypothetical protein GY928_02335 [Colwellia sp.]|nr:hypothetical protein [Colwellia sp.]
MREEMSICVVFKKLSFMKRDVDFTEMGREGINYDGVAKNVWKIIVKRRQTQLLYEEELGL